MATDETGQVQTRSLSVLQQLLERPALELREALRQATGDIAAILGCDKVDAFLLDEERHSLVALGTSETPMGRLQKALGLDVLPIANGGRTVESFRTGRSYASGRLDQDAAELRGLVQELGIRSIVNVPFQVDSTRRGVLSAASAQPEFFKLSDLQLLEVIGRSVGALAHRAELVEQIRTAEAREGRRTAAEEIITVLAHDLRNHLNPLIGRMHVMRLKLLEKQPIDPSEIDAALRSIQRISRLTHDLLDVARLDQGLFVMNLAPVDLAALTRETAAILNTEAVPVRVRAPHELLIIADANRLRQALENVVANAVSYSPVGRAVELEVQISTQDDSPGASIEVIDQGPGIPEELLSHIFERFWAGSKSAGLGLGLYLAQAIARAHGGRLTVDSHPGLGTRFRFELPIEGQSGPQ